MNETGSFIGRVRAWINEGAGRWVAIVLGVGGLAAAVVIFLLANGHRDAVEKIRQKKRDVFYVCKACEQTGQTKISYDEKFPIVCPKCRRREAAAGFRCTGLRSDGTRCGEILEVQQIPVITCPFCGHVYDNRLIPPEARGGEAP